ncbi:MAG: hypothetical protein HY537_15580 [Deltaproteobacteria bacterium]|nr:hypothetical protein [Deltaproteobacteria bacterium]
MNSNRKLLTTLLRGICIVSAMFLLQLLLEKECGTLNDDNVTGFITYLNNQFPKLYPHDPLLPSMRGYLTVVYDVFHFFSSFLGEKWAYVCLLFASKILLLATMYTACLLIYHSEIAASLALLCILVPHGIMGDSWTAKFSGFFPESFGQPMCLLALAFLFARKHWLFGICTFLSFYVHAMSATWCLLLGTGILILSKKWRQLFSLTLLGTLVLAPFFYHYFSHSSFGSINSDLVTTVARWRSTRHLFFLSWPVSEYIAPLITMLFMALTVHQVLKHFNLKSELQFFRHFILMSVGLWIAGILFTEWIPLRLMYSLQLLRSSSLDFLVLTAFFGGCLALANARTEGRLFLCIPTAAVVYIFLRSQIDYKNALFVLIFLSGFLIISRTDIQITSFSFYKAWGRASWVLLCCILSVVIFTRRVYRPNLLHQPYRFNWDESLGNVYGNGFLGAAAWARNHTNASALFVTHPAEIGFRYFSRRSTVLNWKDGGIIILYPKITEQFVSVLAGYGFRPPGPPDLENVAASSIIKVGMKNKADYALIPIASCKLYSQRIPASASCNGNVVYENDTWKIIKLNQDN